MPKLYLVTIDGRSHPYCVWNNEPVPVFKGDTTRYTLLAETNDTAEAIWLFEVVEDELRRRRRAVAQEM